VLVAQLPPTSRFGREQIGDAADWSRTDHLLAGVFDLVNVVIWQNANQGRKSRTPRPQPLPRPGIEPKVTRYGTPRPLSEVKAILAASRPDRPDDELLAPVTETSEEPG
jgi:hypothetical protein